MNRTINVADLPRLANEAMTHVVGTRIWCHRCRKVGFVADENGSGGITPAGEAKKFLTLHTPAPPPSHHVTNRGSWCGTADMSLLPEPVSGDWSVWSTAPGGAQ